MQNTAALTPATKVQIYTSELVVDPNIYVIENHERSIVNLRVICSFCSGNGLYRGDSCKHCKGSGASARHRVHQSRIAKVFDHGGNIVYESNVIIKEKQMTTPTQKQPVDIVNLNTLKEQGELFTKQVSFDHNSISVEANVLIDNDHKSFRVFNTYNGTLGKKNKTGKSYVLSDSNSYDRKVSQLSKQGYKKT